MVTEKDVEDFMLSVFPTCPLCEATNGYEVSGFSKNYVQCRSCRAKWLSHELPKCKKLTFLVLWETSKDGKGVEVLKKTESVNYWKKFKDINADSGTINGISIESDDEVLRSELITSLRNLKGYEVSTLGNLTILFTGSTAEHVMTKLLKVLVDQNKIMIIQNELLLRVLNRNNDNQEKS